MRPSLGAAACLILSSVAAALEPLPRDPTLSPADIAWLNRPPEDCGVTPEPPPPPPPPREPRLELQGLIQDTEGGTRAIINDELVREGDSVRGARVVRITRDCVSLRWRKRLLRRCIRP